MMWRLMVFAVPDRLSGLLGRLGFRATKKNPSNWWRVFDPAQDKEAAQYARGQLLAAGLKGKWTQVEAQKRTASGARIAKPQYSHHGFGGKLNATPIAGSWRIRKRRD